MNLRALVVALSLLLLGLGSVVIGARRSNAGVIGLGVVLAVAGAVLAQYLEVTR